MGLPDGAEGVFIHIRSKGHSVCPVLRATFNNEVIKFTISFKVTYIVLMATGIWTMEPSAEDCDALSVMYHASYWKMKKSKF